MNQQTIDLFSSYLEATGNNNIEGKVKQVDLKKGTGTFWVQKPKKLVGKKTLPFLFSAFTNRSYKPQAGDIFYCDFSITNSGVKFSNITLKSSKTNRLKTTRNNLSKRTNNRNRKNKTKRKKKFTTPKVLQKPTPRVFIIFGHSYECSVVYLTPNTKILKLLEQKYEEGIARAQNPSIPYDKSNIEVDDEIEWAYQTLQENVSSGLPCVWHKETKSPPSAMYLNKTRLEKGHSGITCCKKCATNYFKNDKLIKFNNTINKNKYEIIDDPNRIDLTREFADILPKNNIKFLNAQSTGRQGLTNTSFNIMESMQNNEEFRQLIYNSKTNEDMSILDNYLNIVNKQHAFHGDRKDTNFAIYPRINPNGENVNGPKDSNITFFPSSGNPENAFYNGATWPAGIFELPVFDVTTIPAYIENEKFSTLFKNYSGATSHKDTTIPEWEFFSVIKDVSSYDLMKRALLLEIPESKPETNPNLTRYLQSLTPDLDELTVYNKWIMDKIDDRYSFDPQKPFKLSDIMRNVIKLANIKPDEEVIFISNICRTVRYPSHEDYWGWNQTAKDKGAQTGPKYTRNLIEKMRRNSRGNKRT